MLTVLLEILSSDAIAGKKSIPRHGLVFVYDLLGVAPNLAFGTRTFENFVD